MILIGEQLNIMSQTLGPALKSRDPKPIQEMAKDEALKNIPVVMLTGIKEKVGIGFSADEMKDYMGMKPAAYLEKPIDPAKVRETMKKILPI